MYRNFKNLYREMLTECWQAWRVRCSVFAFSFYDFPKTLLIYHNICLYGIPINNKANKLWYFAKFIWSQSAVY